MIIKQFNEEMLIGHDELGFTHLCLVNEYYEPYVISKAQAEMAKMAGVITEEEYINLTESI